MPEVLFDVNVDVKEGEVLALLGTNGDGKAGTPELVVRFPPGEEPAGIAPLPDGSLVVALRGANEIVLVGPDGAEVRRVTGSAGDTALDAPTSVAFHGQTMLVTNQAPSTKQAWAILAVGVPR